MTGSAATQTTLARSVLIALTVLVALVLQTTVLPLLTSGTQVPQLCLLVVVGVGLAGGETPGTVTGFAAGLALDLTPPADHLAGRWALALLVVGYLAGRLGPATPRRGGGRRVRLAGLARLGVLVAAASFVGTSVYALSGLLFGEVAWSVPDLLEGVGVAVLLDTLAGVLVLPALLRLLGARAPRESVRPEPALGAAPTAVSPTDDRTPV
jgi:rod shape-determining protein MreD